MANDQKNNTHGGAGTHSVDVPPIPPRTFWQTINPGYVIAGLSTLATSLLAISKNFRKTLDFMGLTKGLDESKRKVLSQYPIEGLINGDESYKRLDKVASEAKAANASNAEIDKLVVKEAARIEQEIGRCIGVDGNVLKRPFQKFSKLPDFYKGQISATVVTVTSIALGAVYSFARERHLTNQLNREMARRNAEQAQSNGGPGV